MADSQRAVPTPTASSLDPAFYFRPTRPTWNTLEALTLGDLTIDFRRREVRCDGLPSALVEQYQLTTREFRLIAYFAAHRGEVIGRETLLMMVWGYRETPLTRTVDMHVAKLRKKIEPDPRHPRYLLTVHGRGYLLAERSD